MENPIIVNVEGSFIARSNGLSVDVGANSGGAPICKLARKLVEASHDPENMVHVYRGDTLCFRPVSRRNGGKAISGPGAP